MNRSNRRSLPTIRTLLGIACASTLLAACVSAPVPDDGSAEVRARLTALKGNPPPAGHAGDSP